MIWSGLFAYSALAGVGVALAAGPLGCFVLWRRMAYFGDATAHAAMLGVALSLGFSISIEAGVLVVALAVALGVSSLSGRTYGADALLGVAAHASLALGLVAVSLTSGGGVGLEAYLFGEILAVGGGDLGVIWGGAALVLALLAWRWEALLTATISPEIARAEGIRPKYEELILTFTLALVVAAALKVVGALMITAMLVIPAAAARPFARGPEAMAVLAALIGALAALAGLALAFVIDTPAGPTIVVMAAFAFLVSVVLSAALARLDRLR